MSMPTWLKAQLVLAGRWNTDGVTRTARGRRCDGCGEGVLVGLDADLCAGPATVTPTPLSTLGEAVARMGGTCTYRLSIFAGRLTLDCRDQWTIRDQSPDDPDRTFDVVADHVCGGPTWPSTTSALPRPTTRQETADVPF
jgi:hypothetical protein